MNPWRKCPTLTALAALASVCIAAYASACIAAGAAVRASPPPRQTAPAPAGAPASRAAPKVCLVVQTSDDLTRAFADRLREAVVASGALSLAATSDSCDLQLHVPGNLLRFETAGGILVSTVVIVTSPSDRYLSASITACRVNELAPCAARAVAAAKLALLVSSDGT